MILAIDYETQSAADVKNGAPAYAEHDSTAVLCGVFILADRQQVHAVSRWTPALALPAWAVRHVEAGGPVLAHNHSFEASIHRWLVTPRYGFPEVAPDQWVDTLQIAAVLGLPLSLEGLGTAIGAAVQKDAEGHKLMLELCKPKRRGEPLPVPTPAQLERLLDYCEIDVRATIECWRRLPALRPEELAAQAVDHKINERGVLLGFDLAAKMRQLAAQRVEEIRRDTWGATQDIIAAGPQALIGWLQGRGVAVPKALRVRSDGSKELTDTIGRAAIAELLAGSLPPDVRRALELRVEAGRITSLGKLAKLDSVANSDNRSRWLLRYAKATTARWASEVLQLHNLPRSTKAFKKIADDVLDAVRAGDYERVASLHPALEALSYSLRALVVARPGCRLIGGDYSAVEARVVAWLAGQDDVLGMFASGVDVYTADAKAIGSDNRQLGKTCRLGLGYQMGAVRFMETAARDGVPVAPADAKRIVTAWRQANARIVAFWHALEEAFAEAHRERSVVAVGEHLLVRGTKESVQVVLPSGRALHYWRPFERPAKKRVEVVTDEGEIVEKEIETVEQRYYVRQGAGMVVEGTYGGHLAENATQAVARDLLRDALLRLDRTPYDVVLHVHDSAVAEVPDGFGSVREFEELMAVVPDWAPGLPVKVEGYESRHFRG